MATDIIRQRLKVPCMCDSILPNQISKVYLYIYTRVHIIIELDILTYCLALLPFAGFLGLCTLLLLWPGLVILHITKIEELVWPDTLEWAVLFVNGIVGVVISNLLWLW